ncbi:arginine--tRNA ligase [Candidatus Woesearchaeota archaeon]|nr:arginine--tRNA ligase [Candidatus Woesearchaeota archaeon]
MDYRQKIEQLIRKHVPEGDIQLTVPPDSMGDFALPCFPFAKVLKKSPLQIAEELQKKLKADFIEKTEVKGGYLNIFVSRQDFVQDILKKVLKEGKEFGRGKPEKTRVMVEFSQANTHKAFHVGHIRGTSLGESLARILEFGGKHVVRVNYQGDTGMHVAKWLWCYQKFHPKAAIKKDEAWFASIYVEAVKKLAEHPEFEPDVEELNRKLDVRDKSILEIWQKTRKTCLESLESIYTELNTRFDHYFFESEMEEPAKKISRELAEKGIAEISDGATIIRLDKYNLGVWVLLRKDGTVLYSSKDIALAQEKFTTHKIDVSVYVVGKEQEMHIMQLFKTLELMGFKQAKDCVYVPVSLVKLPAGRMSSRTGENILYSEFKNELIEEASQEVKKRFKVSEEEADKRALAIAVAAMKYAMLKQHPNKEIIFRKEESMRFEGDTGPYLLYSYARAASILRKAAKPGKLVMPALHEKEIALSKCIGEFPEKVGQAARQMCPSILANYAYTLAQVFNEFYTECKVIGAKEEPFRLALVEAFKMILGSSLNLLGIEVLEEM